MIPPSLHFHFRCPLPHPAADTPSSACIPGTSETRFSWGRILFPCRTNCTLFRLLLLHFLGLTARASLAAIVGDHHHGTGGLFPRQRQEERVPPCPPPPCCILGDEMHLLLRASVGLIHGLHRVWCCSSLPHSQFTSNSNNSHSYALNLILSKVSPPPPPSCGVRTV